ncbi:GIY-YIG nuclease family protein [Kitasatospora sp. NPDC088779]|uniref:GIY-YIG nuclease family protein n=1 Tax=Kitasatospora sp. NPDC088779 TaxID=3154964 RepID=UPI00342A4631
MASFTDPRLTTGVLNVEINTSVIGAYWAGYRVGYLLAADGPEILPGYTEATERLEYLEDLHAILEEQSSTFANRHRIKKIKEEKVKQRKAVEEFNPEDIIKKRSREIDLELSFSHLTGRERVISGTDGAYSAGIINGWVWFTYQRDSHMLNPLVPRQAQESARKDQEVRARISYRKPPTGSSVPHASRTHVYMMTAAGSRLIKIGVAKNPMQRLRELQTGSPGKLDVLWLVEGTRALEKALHGRLSAYRARGEWFDLNSLGNPAEAIEKHIAEIREQNKSHLSRYFYEDDATTS